MNKVAPLFCRRQKNDNIFRAILNPNRWQARYLVLIAAGSCAKCGSDGREPKVHERKMDHAHKEVRPSAYISTHSLLYNTVLPPALFTGAGGNIANRATSLLLWAAEVVMDFFMCFTRPTVHFCGVWLAVFVYVTNTHAR